VREKLVDFPVQYRKNNLAYSIEYPDEYIVAAIGLGEWYSYYFNDNEDCYYYDKDLWGGVSRKKTIYDPCPEGWRVPLAGTTAYYPYPFLHSPWDPLDQFTRVDPAYYSSESPLLGFYIGTGAIEETGELNSKHSQGLWTATGLPVTWDWGDRSISVDLYTPVYAWPPTSCALNLRCVRDLEQEKN
jgi:hypothetical protein